MDTFVRDRLPPPALWPVMDFGGVPELGAYPARFNCAVELLDRMVEAGHRDRPVLHFGDAVWSYARLKDTADRIARVLTEDMGVRPGNRVLLRGTNTPMLTACWFAVVKAGGVVVATMPLLRAGELAYVIDKAEIGFALCHDAWIEELELARAEAPRLAHVLTYTAGGDGDGSLERAMAKKPSGFNAADTAADDPMMIAFTSGTTGKPKGTVHFHRDVLAICDTFARHVYRVEPDDIFVGSPPLGFTFGLGALVTFPMRFGASSVMVEAFGPTTMLETVERYRVTGMYTAPTAYRAMVSQAADAELSSLRKCVSAGEHLPPPTWEAWRDATGIRIIDGIGATEMLHIFISAAGDDIRPGATGRAIPGYRARVVDTDGNPVSAGEQGWLAIQGPTGCRYLDDPDRQRGYVKDGWNFTGDIFRADENGYFWYVARGDDMIISAGYNISGPEVEDCLLAHPDVAECAVIGAPDIERGSIVRAYVVLGEGAEPDEAATRALQDFVKAEIAPYKYPRSIVYRDKLPRTETGKLQRFKLRQEAMAEFEESRT